jgi:hypothetical protein
MARLFKHTIIEYWIPAHHVDSEGNPCAADAPGARLARRRKVRKGTPDAEKVTKRSTKWYGAFTDEHGQARRVPLSKNKTVAQQKLGVLLGKVDKAGVGDPDPYEEHRRRPLAEHLADYEADLKARRRGAKYVREVIANARRVITACRFVFFSTCPPRACKSSWPASVRAAGTGSWTRTRPCTRAASWPRPSASSPRP